MIRSGLCGATSDRGPRRVLMIACGFPPTGGPGVQRSAKFAKYLPRFGWQPVVWCAGPLQGLSYDPTLLADLPPSVEVHALPATSGVHAIRAVLPRTNGGRGITGSIARGMEWRLDSWFARGAVPDEYVAWACRSLKPVLRLVEDRRIDAVYSTFSPGSNHLLALEIKRQTDLPWVADFRDLWTDDYRYVEPSGPRRAKHRRLEQQILETADRVIGVSDAQTKILAAHVTTLAGKFLTITNGFDPSDFREQDTAPRRLLHRFVIAHVGRLDQWRAGDGWFGGLQRFVNAGATQRKRFVLQVVGHAYNDVRVKLCATGARCEFTGEVTHSTAVAAMQAADALLLLVPNGPNAESVIPGKLFEYLASHRPILVVGPPGGEAERIVRACKAGIAVNFDESGVAQALERVYEPQQAGCPLPGCAADQLAPYDRARLTRRLASVLDELTSGSAEPSGSRLELVEACA